MLIAYSIVFHFSSFHTYVFISCNMCVWHKYQKITYLLSCLLVCHCLYVEMILVIVTAVSILVCIIIICIGAVWLCR